MNMNGSTTTTTTTTTTSLNNNKFIDESMNMEFDGNENLLNFESQTTKFVDDLMNNAVPQQLDNEFGPETDVDAVDEAMLMSSPHSVSQEDDQMLAKEFQQLEQKEIDFAESAPANPFLQENMFGLPKEVLGGGDDETEPGEYTMDLISLHVLSGINWTPCRRLVFRPQRVFQTKFVTS